jgi:hypothetical protein
MDWQQIDNLLTELEAGQHSQLYSIGRRIVPSLTQDDLLQPNDFPELENHACFRYEEGILAGIQTTRMALLALRRDQSQLQLTQDSV